VVDNFGVYFGRLSLNIQSRHLYTRQRRYWRWSFRNPAVHMSVCLSIFLVSGTPRKRNESLSMKLYTVMVYNLSMCMKEDNSGSTNVKGDNSREMIICAGQGYPL